MSIEISKKERDFVTRELYDALKHGDTEHCAWLYDAIYAYFHDQPVPPVRGSGNKEAKIKELQEKVAELERALSDADYSRERL